MSGIFRIRRNLPLIIGMGLLCLPSVLHAQTGVERARAEERMRVLERVRAEELARAEVLRERMEARLQFTEQARLERLTEARFRVQEELARVKSLQEGREGEIRELDQERAREIEARIRAAREATARNQETIRRVQEKALGRAREVMVQVRPELENMNLHLENLRVDVAGLDRWSSAGFGLKLAEMNPGLADYFSSEEGLLVLEMEEDSSLGLLPGDVLLSIGGRIVDTQRDVRRILGSYEKDEAVSFTVIRKGRETIVEGTVG